MNVGSLFAGIGGVELGLERAGDFEPAWFVEWEPYAQAVLRKQWPGVPVYGDIRSINFRELPRVDVLTGGFPCQDISNAGKRAGIKAGTRSGLWKEYLRAISEIRPRYIIVENVAAILNRGIEIVLGDLAAIGYDAEWHCIPAASVGAPHRRDRIFIMAYTNGDRCECFPGTEAAQGCNSNAQLASISESSHVANATCRGFSETGELRCEESTERIAGSGEVFSNALCAGLEGERLARSASNADWWSVEPDVGRVANGVPSRVDRIKCLGNAVVPQVAQIIGEAIMRADK